MKREQELIVITKTYDLILWSCNHTSKFPRNHRFVLGERIERNLYNLLETLIQAKYTRNRQRLLEQANLSPLGSFEVDCPLEFPNLETAVRGHISTGVAAAAIRQAGVEAVQRAIAEALAPFRTSEGGYRQRNRLRYVIAVV